MSYQTKLKYAKLLRSKMSDAERNIWYRVRARRLNGLKFKRQMPIGKYTKSVLKLGLTLT